MSGRQRRRSMKFATASAFFTILGVSCIGPGILTLAALKVGAGEFYVGLLTFVIMIAMQARILTMNQWEKYGKKKVLLSWRFVSLFMIIPLILLGQMAGRLDKNLVLTLLLIIVALRWTTSAMGNTAWFPILHDIVPKKVTGRFFGNLRTYWQICAMVSTLAVAFFIGNESRWWKFEVIFVVGLLGVLISTLCLIPITEIPKEYIAYKRKSILRRFRELLSDKTLRHLTLYISFFLLAVSIWGPFRITYLKKLGYSEGFILGAMAMYNFGAILSLKLWGKISDRFGNRPILDITLSSLPIITFCWIFVGSNSSALAMLLFFTQSVAANGNMLVQTRFQLNAISLEDQNHINVMNTITGLSASVAPLAGGALLSRIANFNVDINNFSLNGYRLFFIICSAFFAVPFMLKTGLQFSSDRTAGEVIAIYSRPVINAFGPFIERIKKNRDN